MAQTTERVIGLWLDCDSGDEPGWIVSADEVNEALETQHTTTLAVYGEDEADEARAHAVRIGQERGLRVLEMSDAAGGFRNRVIDARGKIMALKPGEHYGLPNRGWPPSTVFRDTEGNYWLSRLTKDLRSERREPLTKEQAEALIEDDGDTPLQPAICCYCGGKNPDAPATGSFACWCCGQTVTIDPS